MLDTSNTQSFDDFKIFFTLANLHSTVLCKMFEVFKRKDVSKYKYGYCYEFFPNCYAYEWPQLWPLIDFAWVCDFINVRFSKSMAQSRIHRKNTHIANS